MTRKKTSLGQSTYTLDWDGEPSDRSFAVFTRSNPGQKRDLTVHIPKNLIIAIAVEIAFDTLKDHAVKAIIKASK